MCLAVPGQILSVSGEEPLLRMGRVSFSGVVKEVHLGCVPEAGVGDRGGISGRASANC